MSLCKNFEVLLLIILFIVIIVLQKGEQSTHEAL